MGSEVEGEKGGNGKEYIKNLEKRVKEKLRRRRRTKKRM